jgi:hypothetical protein
LLPLKDSCKEAQSAAIRRSLPSGVQREIWVYGSDVDLSFWILFRWNLYVKRGSSPEDKCFISSPYFSANCYLIQNIYKSFCPFLSRIQKTWKIWSQKFWNLA